jgi:mono/diheme cytochrome c family protein
MGEWIRRGEAIFLRTPANAVGFSGNTLNCVNCHLDAGRLKGAAPMWGAYPLYPAYRKKTNHVDTFAERVRGCFMYSMNGKAPDDGHDILVALEAYAYWMAQKAPTGEKLPGAGFTKVGKAAQEPSFERGAKVYEAKCALCHGAQGQGQACLAGAQGHLGLTAVGDVEGVQLVGEVGRVRITGVLGVPQDLVGDVEEEDGLVHHGRLRHGRGDGRRSLLLGEETDGRLVGLGSNDLGVPLGGRGQPSHGAGSLRLRLGLRRGSGAETLLKVTGGEGCGGCSGVLVAHGVCLLCSSCLRFVG